MTLCELLRGIVDVPAAALEAVGAKEIRVPETVIAPRGLTVWPPMTMSPCR